MKYTVTDTKDTAMNLLHIYNNGIRISEAIPESASVIIYGFGFFGLEIYKDISEGCNLLCFIDRAHDGETYDGVPVYSLYNDILIELASDVNELCVIITPYTYWDDIVPEVERIIPNAKCVSLYCLTAKLKLDRKNSDIFCIDEKTIDVETILNMINGDKIEIDQVVVTGTNHALFLGMLLVNDWKRTLFVNGGTAGKAVSLGMRKNGIPCMCWDEEIGMHGGIMDIVNCIARYCIDNQIPVWGQDHIAEAEPFIECGMKVLEDGWGHYDEPAFLDFLSMSKDRKPYRPGGYNERVSEVYFTGIREMCDEFPAEKMVIIDPKELWKKASLRNGEDVISNVFGFPYKDLCLYIAQGRDVLFLSEDFCNCKEYGNGNILRIRGEINRIVEGIDPTRIVVKPHPADITDYNDVLPGCSVLCKSFPAELIAYSGLSFDTVIVFRKSTVTPVFEKNYTKVEKYSFFDCDVW